VIKYALFVFIVALGAVVVVAQGKMREVDQQRAALQLFGQQIHECQEKGPKRVDVTDIGRELSRDLIAGTVTYRCLNGSAWTMKEPR
jgi:hypothetical protein